MSDWNSNPFSDRGPWFSVWRGGARRRPKSQEDANSCDEVQESEAQTGPLAADEESEARPISIFKKAGWVEAETKFKTMATLFAEFQIHPALKDRPVEFQLLRRKDGAFVHDESALGKPDASGRATATVPIYKAYSESDTFRIQVRHGGMAWSHSKNTDREVRETAEVVFEHKAVSGIHFPENSSFIVPAYLTTFRELSKAFTEWRRTHPDAKIVVFGHAERNEEDPRKLSERRAKIASAYLTGDYSTWGDIAMEERWGVWEQQHMLQALGFYEETVDGMRGPKTEKAILDFITWLNEAECKGINPMLGFTEEYIRLELYRVYITGSKRAVSIPIGKIRTVVGYPYVGCAAFNRYKGSDGNHGENRRATFLMLEESVSFPVPFPCRSTVGPCEAEAGKAGERAVKGFRCNFYDDIMRRGEGKAGEHVDTSSRAIPLSLSEKKRIMKIISKFEGVYYSCNADTEFSGSPDDLSYAGIVHIGLSWGFIQFTQDSGSLGKVLERMHGKDPELFLKIFGDNYLELLSVTTAQGISGQRQFENAGGKRIAEKFRKDGKVIYGPRVKEVEDKKGGTKVHIWKSPWLERFVAAGKEKSFQDVQDEVAIESYLNPALSKCRKYNIRTDRGIALAFDRVVNQGVGGFASLCKKKANSKPISGPESEKDFIRCIRDHWKPDQIIYKRIDKIIESTEFKDCIYDF